MLDATVLDIARRWAEMLTPGDLDETLQEITSTAVEVLPSVDRASITILHADGRLDTVAATDGLLPRLDREQHRLEEGPCYQAVKDESRVVCTDLASDERFPAYGPFAVSEGVHSQIGVPLYDSKSAHGALNLYSCEVDAFDDAGALSALFASQAGMAIAYAQQVSTLSEAVATRTAIGQAVGIVMERYGLSDEHAFAYLKRLSSHANLRLRLIAEQIVSATGSKD